MTVQVVAPPVWLQQMRRIKGTLEVPGSGDNPIILSWGGVITSKFPEMKAYCANYTHDEIAWCGYSMGYVFAMAGIRPPYNPKNDFESFMWAQGWKKLPGERLPHGSFRTGCVCVLACHVTMFDHKDENGYWFLGGNQGDAVKLSLFNPDSIEMAIWPSGVTSVILPGTTNFSTRHTNLWLQRSLNLLSGQLTKLLDEDGEYGENTYAVVRDFQQAYRKPVTGMATGLDVAAIETELTFRRLAVSDV